MWDYVHYYLESVHDVIQWLHFGSTWLVRQIYTMCSVLVVCVHELFISSIWNENPCITFWQCVCSRNVCNNLCCQKLICGECIAVPFLKMLWKFLEGYQCLCWKMLVLHWKSKQGVFTRIFNGCILRDDIWGKTLSNWDLKAKYGIRVSYEYVVN